MMADGMAEIVGTLNSEMVVLWGYLAAQLIREGLADRETMIADIERMAADAPEGRTLAYRAAADLLKKTRPWGVIDGGKGE